MLKRIPLILLALLVIGGTVWWLGKSQLGDKVAPIINSSSSAKVTQKPLSDTSSEEPTTIEVLSSPRHSAGEIERHQQARAVSVELEKAVVQQQQKVEEHRKLLAIISRTKGIIYKEADLKFDEIDQSSPGFENNAKSQMSAAQAASLLKYTDEQLLVYAAGLDLPDNSIKELYPQLLTTRRELQELRAAGSGADASSIALQDARFNAIQSQLNEELAGVRKTMVELIQESDQRGRDAQAYLDAKRDFETDQQLLDSMKSKLAAEKERVRNGER